MGLSITLEVPNDAYEQAKQFFAELEEARESERAKEERCDKDASEKSKKDDDEKEEEEEEQDDDDDDDDENEEDDEENEEDEEKPRKRQRKEKYRVIDSIDFSYSGYGRFRQYVLNGLGGFDALNRYWEKIPLMIRLQLGMIPVGNRKYFGPIETMTLEERTTLEKFSMHSDCDGEFSTQECEQLYKLFKTHKDEFMKRMDQAKKEQGEDTEWVKDNYQNLLTYTFVAKEYGGKLVYS